MPDQSSEKAQRLWARVAGFVYLFLIALYLGLEYVTSSIAGGAGFAEKAHRIAESQLAYRAALSINVILAAATVVLAVALYETLKPVNGGLARLALCWRLGEAFLEGVSGIAAFVIAWLYVSPQSVTAPGQVEALVTMMGAFDRSAFVIITIFFGFGSTVFFYLFVRSRYLPRLISVFGLLASLLVPVMGLASLIDPEGMRSFEAGWYPIFTAEIIAGLWLLFFAVRIPATPPKDA